MAVCDWMTSTPKLEPLEYLKKPHVITRFVCLVFSVFTSGVIHSDCSMFGRCVFNDDSSACNYGVFLGCSTALLCLIYLVLDVWTDNISNCYTRRTIVLIDFCLTGFWCFLWFSGFCMFCNRWQFTSEVFMIDNRMSYVGPRVVIGLSFFTFLILGILVYLCSNAYTAVRLVISGMDAMGVHNTDHVAGNFGAYNDPRANAYHGFTGDTDLLDATRPAQLGSDSPSFNTPHFDRGTKLSGGAFSANPVEAYQP
ncbi:hypothetical protein P879_08015 [Paragonimus westermani]|uniref:MARVEL domain-containing protein n=1 Tax=Paragonimus westermani TaxID=34504 RepID=A0A8T0DBQ0_9TREM|nr:hypothetical protein P879_08015 [Paragonimus westermani]